MKKLLFNTSDVLPQLVNVASIVNAKNAMPSLAMIKFTTSSNGGDSGNSNTILTLTASDGETWIEKKACISNESDTDIAFLVDANGILSAIKNLQEKNISIDIDELRKVIIGKHESGTFEMPYSDVESFPMPQIVESPDADTSFELCLSSKDLLTAIESVAFAAGNDEIRQILCGVHIDLLQDKLVCVATDSRTLAKYETTIQGEGQEARGFTIQAKVANLISKTFATMDESDVQVYAHANVIEIVGNDVHIYSRLIDGKYPNYNAVIPSNFASKATIGRIDLMNALKRVIPLGNAQTSLVCIKLSNGNLSIHADNQDFSTCADENIACDYANDEITIGFSGNALLVILSRLNDEKVVLNIVSAERPCVITPNTIKDGVDYATLLMPMRL